MACLSRWNGEPPASLSRDRKANGTYEALENMVRTTRSCRSVFLMAAGCEGGGAPDAGSEKRAVNEAASDTDGPASRTVDARAATSKLFGPDDKASEVQADPERERYLRAARANQANERLLGEKLDEPISMSFANETPLEDVLRYIKQATTTQTFEGIPIYVDPIGLAATERSVSSTVHIDVEGVPLKTSLKTVLNSIGLTYEIDEMVLVVTKKDLRQKHPPSRPIWPSDPATRAILAELEHVLPIPFSKETPLDEVLNHIRTKTKSTELPDGIPIEIDPQVLAEVGGIRTKAVELELEGVPLRLCLMYMLDQLGLSYIVSIGKIRIVHAG